MPQIAEQLAKIQHQMDEHLQKGHSVYLEPHASLGWSIKPESQHYSLPYTSNSYGFRKVLSAPQTDFIQKRIAFFGDSLVHGDEISDEFCWINQLQQQLPQTLLLNGGVPGYGTDQALMRFEENVLVVDQVFLGVALCDETRNINILRLHRSKNTALPFMKPRFIPSENGLQKVLPPFAPDRPLHEHYLDVETQQFLKQYDFYYPNGFWKNAGQNRLNRFLKKMHLPFWFGKDPFKLARTITFQILERFFQVCEARALKGTLLLIPTEAEISKRNKGLDVYVQELERRHWAYLDLREAFPADFSSTYPNMADIWCPQGHFGRQSSAWIASFLASKIREEEGSH